MRVSVVVLLSLAVTLVAMSHAATAQSAAADPLPPLLRARREGTVGIDVDHPKGGKSTATVNGEANVWKGDRDRRVDVHGSADTRGNRRGGVSYKW